MKAAADALLQTRANRPFGDFRLLVVSDGEAQDADLLEQFLPDIKGRGLTIDVIGVAMNQAHSLATQVDRYRRADDEQSLVQAIRESLAETSGDMTDTDADADFELLQAIPDEMAIAAIGALSSFDNVPIGEGAVQVGDVPTPSVTLPVPGNPYGTQQPPEPHAESKGSRIVFIAIFMVFMLIVKSVMRGSQHRRY